MLFFESMMGSQEYKSLKEYLKGQYSSLPETISTRQKEHKYKIELLIMLVNVSLKERKYAVAQDYLNKLQNDLDLTLADYAQYLGKIEQLQVCIIILLEG